MGNATEACSTTGVWGSPTACTNQACLTTGLCGGSCTPNTFECSSLIGLVCSTTGQWVSNGSTDACLCSAAAGRFTKAGTGLVLDTSTGLTWDMNMHSAATWTAASGICGNEGMRLPTFGEWTGVLLLSTCLYGTPAPFDQAAMPTTNGDLGLGTVYALWTGTVEPGYGGDDVFVLGLASPTSAGQQWATFNTDSTTMNSYPYRCVE
jgi:hypothetical protein